MKKIILLCLALSLSMLLVSQRTIYSYPDASDVNGEDLLLGTSNSTLKTKNFKLSDVSDFVFSDNGNIKVLPKEVIIDTGTLWDNVNALPAFTVAYDELCVITSRKQGTNVVLGTYFLTIGSGNYGIGGIVTTSNDYLEVEVRVTEGDVQVVSSYGWVADEDVDLAEALMNIESRAAAKSENNAFSGNNTFSGTTTLSNVLYANSNVEVNGVMNVNNNAFFNADLGIFDPDFDVELLFFTSGTDASLKYDAIPEEMYLNNDVVLTGDNVIAGSNIVVTPSSTGITISSTGTVSTTDVNVEATGDYGWIGTTGSSLATMLSNIETDAANLNDYNSFSDGAYFGANVFVQGQTNMEELYLNNGTDDVRIEFSTPSNSLQYLKYEGDKDRLSLGIDPVITASGVTGTGFITIASPDGNVEIGTTLTESGISRYAWYDGVTSTSATDHSITYEDFLTTSNSSCAVTVPNPITNKSRVLTIQTAANNVLFSITGAYSGSAYVYPYTGIEYTLGSNQIALTTNLKTTLSGLFFSHITMVSNGIKWKVIDVLLADTP